VRERRIAFPETNLEKRDVVVAELMEEYLALRKSCGDLKIQWMPHDTRDQVIDFVRRWGGRRSPPGGLCAGWACFPASSATSEPATGKLTSATAGLRATPGWEAWEKRAILDFYGRFPLRGYRRLTFMMLDAGVAAVSPTSARRVSHPAGRRARRKDKPLSQGKGFQAPPGPHQRCHVGISYFDLPGTFYYLCSGLDGYNTNGWIGKFASS